MARYIDADALKNKWLSQMMWWSKQTDDYCDGSHWTDVYADFIQELNKAPTVDAVEVVRCKDCRYCSRETEHPFCEKLNDYCKDFESYCAYAVKKERTIEVQVDELAKRLGDILREVECSIVALDGIREDVENGEEND